MVRKALPVVAFVALVLSGCQEAPAEPEPVQQAVGVASMVDAKGQDRPDFRALEAALAKDPALVIPAEALELVGGAGELRKTIPAGTAFKVHDRTWAYEPVGGGTVRISMLPPEGEELSVVAVMMEDVNQRWYILQTLPLSQVPGATPAR